MSADASELDGQRTARSAAFLLRHEPFTSLGRAACERVARLMTECRVPSEAIVLSEDGAAGTELYVVLDGSIELSHRSVVVDILTTGGVFGIPTLLTGLPPQFTARAREDSVLYCIPGDVAEAVLSGPEGLRFVVLNQRDHLLQAARAIQATPVVRAQTAASLVHAPPLFLDPAMPIREAAAKMAARTASAALVHTRDGLGIVTNTDVRDKVVAGPVPPEAPLQSIASSPVLTVRADAIGAEAAIEMMKGGVQHLPVVDAAGLVQGILSAGDLLALDALSPFAMRRAIVAARSEEELAEVAADVLGLFADLLAERPDPASLTMILTVLADTMALRLLELAVARYGQPPVPYAWLALGSWARNELTLVSDQDSGLAYADGDDPSIADYFRTVGESVTAGLARCGLRPDEHGVTAANPIWCLPLSRWVALFKACMGGWDVNRLLAASIAFDFRQIAGELPAEQALTEIVAQAPRHRRFVAHLADLAGDIRSPLGFRGRLVGPVDVKKSGLLPIQNMARYYAFSAGLTQASTLQRLQGLTDTQPEARSSAPLLRDAFLEILDLRLQHHGQAVHEGRRMDDAVDTEVLRPLARANLREALLIVAAAQEELPRKL